MNQPIFMESMGAKFPRTLPTKALYRQGAAWLFGLPFWPLGSPRCDVNLPSGSEFQHCQIRGQLRAGGCACYCDLGQYCDEAHHFFPGMSLDSSYLEVKLKRLDRVYRPKEKVEGVVIVGAKKGWSHNGVVMVVEGLVYLSHSNRGFAGIGGDSACKPIHLLRQDVPICSAGKFPDGVTELPFEFMLNPAPGQQLLESYHGVFISVVYNIQVTCDRGVMKKGLLKDIEFLVEIPIAQENKESEPLNFSITPEALSNVSSKVLANIPKFSLSGKLHRTKCPINAPLTGEVIIEMAAAPVKSLELQLVRVETVTTEGKTTKEATEVQNIQIGEGNICRNFSVPMYMVFPRIFSCPTLITNQFRIEFEVNLIMIYGDDYMVTENFPIVIYRDVPSGIV